MSKHDEQRNTPPSDEEKEPLTIFLCGPNKCEHDYSGWRDIVIDGQVRGGTTVCTKCGRTAFEEAAWL